MGNQLQIVSGGLVTQQIEVDGSPLPDGYQVHSIQVDKAVNRITSATIVILDGNPAAETFAASSSANFVPGSKLTIAAGYDCKNTSIFSGVITKQTLRVDTELGSALEVECKDESIKMTIGRKSSRYSNMTDSDVLSQIIGNYSGLSSSVTSTTNQLADLVQYYSSDWDFMLTRAEVNGMIVTTLDGKVAVFKPDADTTSVLTIGYGSNLKEFYGELNAITQLSNVKASAWDYKTQQLSSGEAANNEAGPGNLSSKKLSDVIGLSTFELQTTAAESTETLTDWAKAQMLKSEYAKIIGEVHFQGSALVEPGKYITLAGMGDRFNGDHLVSSVCHRVEEGEWVTQVGYGLSPTWFAQEPDIMAPPAAGLLPGVQGLYNGVVKKTYEDPDSEYRILVDLPLFDPDGEGLWARLTNFYSTSGAGAFFIPEVGDEVIVGFLNDDPRYPVVLGSLYSSSNQPFDELDPDENNTIKAIVSKNKLQLKFDDENQILSLLTPAKNQLILDDKNKQVTVIDENQNQLVMSESGIEIKSPKNINITADEKVVISGSMGVEIESSSGDIECSATNIKSSADMEFSAQGGMTSSVQGGTELTLKAAMVMIN